MNERQIKFKELYLANGKSLEEELMPLWNEILEVDFDDNPERMETFLRSFDDPAPSTVSLQDLQEALIELTTLVLGGE